MNTLDAKISKAKAKLLVDYPLFGVLASQVELVLNEDIEAFKSDGIRLEYNDDFILGCELSELEFVFANAALHASLAHEYRKANRSGWLWQLATDYAINDMLVANGLKRPHAAPYTKRFTGLYAEEIYEELKADILRDELEYESDSEADVEPNDKQEQKEQQSLETILKEELFSQEAQTLIQEYIDRDDFPTHMERFFTLGKSGQINWRDELREAIERFYRDNYTYMPPNKKFLSQNIYLPSSSSERINLVVAIDSSGSIDDELLNTFLSELNFLMLSVQNYKIDILVCDEKIHSHETFYSGDILTCKVIGGGATDFRPVFEFVQKEMLDTTLLLYFTDLDGIFPKEPPKYSVKWVSQNSVDLPFGELILL